MQRSAYLQHLPTYLLSFASPSLFLSAMFFNQVGFVVGEVNFRNMENVFNIY